MPWSRSRVWCGICVPGLHDRSSGLVHVSIQRSSHLLGYCDCGSLGEIFLNRQNVSGGISVKPQVTNCAHPTYNFMFTPSCCDFRSHIISSSVYWDRFPGGHLTVRKHLESWVSLQRTWGNKPQEIVDLPDTEPVCFVRSVISHAFCVTLS